MLLEVAPERWVWLPVFASWGWMLGEALRARSLSCCPLHPSVTAELVGWTGMVVAMMVPATIDDLRDVAERSVPERRQRAVFGYLFGYLASWSVLGVTVLLVRQWELAHDMRAAAALFAFGAAWALLPMRERWQRLCHRKMALHPRGWRADRDTFRQGALNAWPCLAMCWPSMLACTITGHNLVVMAGCTGLTVFEKLFRSRREPLVVGSLLLAAWAWAI